MYSTQVVRLAKAVARAEGFGVPGKIPTVRHNPGNIRSAGGTGPVATYPSDADGWNALYRLIQASLQPGNAYYGPQKTIEQIAKTYTGEALYMQWASNVASFLGVSTTTLWGEAGL